MFSPASVFHYAFQCVLMTLVFCYQTRGYRDANYSHFESYISLKDYTMLFCEQIVLILMYGVKSVSPTTTTTTNLFIYSALCFLRLLQFVLKLYWTQK